MNIDETRAKLLDATLAHVPFDGWSGRALRAGAADIGLDPARAANAYPGGPAELLEAFSAETDRRMLEELERRDLASMKLRRRIAAAVRTRLEMLAPHREAVRRGLSFLALLGIHVVLQPVTPGFHVRRIADPVEVVAEAAANRPPQIGVVACQSFGTNRLVL